MDKFGSRCCECNPGIFTNVDVAYVLAYSTVMSHTDARNFQVKNKLNKEELIRNSRGISDRGDLDVKLLSILYGRITEPKSSLQKV